jgi:Ca-activated chloride channel homolog
MINPQTWINAMSRQLIVFIMTVFWSLLILPVSASERPGKLPEGLNPGTLEVLQIGDEKPTQKLEMPLQHTEVKMDISGFVASVVVTQYYSNPFKKPIEAVYTFPLPNDAAVDDMQMTIGERTIKGVIKRRKEARDIYEQARERGQRASLLEQERPNIFTQSIANIMPGDKIQIRIRYVNILRYDEGDYELVFPMVVGPRYISGERPVGHSGTGWALDTDQVPDASRITPPVLRPGTRSGHDIALSVNLDAGLPIKGIASPSHVINIKKSDAHKSTITLHPTDRLPNKDFILRYKVAGTAPEIATIAHHDERGGFFTLMIQPQKTVTDDQVIPRELIFIVDTSGSMRGFPLKKSKEAMEKLINGMRPLDIFNVVRFAGDTGTLWDSPKANTPTNVKEALRYVDEFQGRGGTRMREGILKALAQPANDRYLRIAFLLTDGYIGNEFGILQAIEQEKRGTRVFSLGVGSSVNRYLLERVAEVGRGEAFYVRQDENSQKVIEQFFKRVDRPALAHIEIDWGNLEVSELYPAKIPDLWAGQPIRLHGRYTQGGEARITVRGQSGKQAYEQEVRVQLPKNEPAHETMATVWARQKVRDLMNQRLRAKQPEALVEAITQLGLTYRLMTQWTSFVAVEEKVVNVEGKLETVVQEVEMPEGVDYEGVFGEAPMPVHAPIAKGLASSHFMRGAVPHARGYMPGKQRSKARLGPPSISSQPISPTYNTTLGGSRARLFMSRKETITFEGGQSSLSQSVKILLNQLALYICQNSADIKKIVITGHTDNSSVDNFKNKLSKERAVAVSDYLMKHCAVLTQDKLIIKGQGDSQPIVSNGSAKNRRVEIEIWRNR